MPVNPVRTISRALSRLLWLPACGDRDNHVPAPDAGHNLDSSSAPADAASGLDAGELEEAGASVTDTDSSVPGSGLLDGGNVDPVPGDASSLVPDASAPADASNSIDAAMESDAAIATDAASLADGGDDLSRALLISGVRVDSQRVTLVFAAYCKNLSSCTGVNEADCIVERTGGYMDYVNAGRSLACLDSQLDVHSCRVSMRCAPLQECISLYRSADDLCNRDIPDGG
jgi:hypothetical protein